MSRFYQATACLLLGLAGLLTTSAPGQGVSEGKATESGGFVPTEHYETRSIEGWTVHVNKHLLAEESKLGRAALKLLNSKLYEINRVVPDKALTELYKVPIWLGVDDGHALCAEYHPNREWLRENGYNPDKAKSTLR